MKKYKDTWWSCVLGESGGVISYVELSRKDCIEMFEKQKGKSWKELKKEGWRCIKLSVQEL